MQIDPLRESDLPAALRLSTQAGWNQIESDWRRLLDLWPDSCLAGRADGELIATATLAIYDTPTGLLGWIGMVLVDEAHRRQGYGAAMLDAILEAGRGVGATAFGLDATDLGRHVYLGRGFLDAVGIDRWTCVSLPANGAAHPPSPAVSPTQAQLDQLPDFDARMTGTDRRPLISRFGREPGVRLHVVVSDGRVSGYGIRRPGRTADHIGPVIAESEPEADAMIAALLTDVATTGQRPVLIDVPRGRLAEALPARGFTVARRLVRMVRRGSTESPPLITPQVFAAAGFELG